MRQKMKKRWLVIVALAMMALVGGTLFWVASPVQAAHTHSYRWVIKKNATCTSEGYKNLECSCGACSGSQTIPKTPHNFNVNAATCTTAKKCRTCGYVAQAATGHSWNRGSATCTASKSCTKCGTVSQNALGHCYVQVTTKQPTCGAGGTYETKCSRCGIGSPTGNGSIPATGQHTWDRAEATCTAAKKCTTCGAIGQAAKGHNFYWVEVVKPTCTQVGRRDYKCLACGCVTDSQTLDKVPSHNIVFSKHVDGDCTHNSYDLYKCNNGCGYTEKRNVIKAPGHCFVWVLTTHPTATSDGVETEICSKCNATGNSRIYKADPAIVTTGIGNSSAMEVINSRMKKADYVAQMWRSREATRSNGKWIPKELSDEEKPGKGICTWCALTNLLNRRLALEKSDFAETEKFKISDIAYVASGKAAKYDVNTWENDIYGEKGRFIYIKDYSGANFYHNVYSTRDGSYSIQVSDELQMKSSKTDAVARKNELVEILDKHPEGILIQFDNYSGGYHGFVLTGYYYDQNSNLRFYALDTGNSSYYDANNNWPIEEVYIGRTYGKASQGGVDNIFKNIRFYAVLEY